MTVPAVEDIAPALRSKVFEGHHMGVGKIINVDIIPQARPIRGRIIDAEDLQLPYYCDNT